MTLKKQFLFLTTAISAVALVGCGSNSSSSDDDQKDASRARIVAYGTDYNAGELRFGDLDSLSLEDGSLSFGTDTRLVANGQYVYALNPGNIALIDAAALGTDSAVIGQKSIGENAYPYGIAFNGDDVWVVENGTSAIVKLNAFTLEATDSISLKKFVLAGNTNPSAVAAVIRGDTLAVVMGRLDSYTATKVGLVALFNVKTKELLDTIPLNTYNPTAAEFHNGKLIVTTQGTYNADYGCDADSLRALESVDFAEGKASVLVSGKELGGGLYKLAIDHENGIAYVSVYASYGSVPLVSYDFASGKISTFDEIADAEGALFFDDESGLLIVGDRTYGAEKLYAYSGNAFSEIDGEELLPSYSATVARW